MKQLLKKEILDILRNKRALYEMILIPLLMTPVLSIFFPFLLVFLTEKFFQEEIIRKVSYKNVKKISYKKSFQKIFIENREEAEDLVKEIERAKTLQIVEEENPEEALKKQNIQIYLVIPKNFQKKLASSEKIFLNTTLKLINIKTVIAFLKLNRIIENYNQKILNKKIATFPVKLKINNLAKPSEFAGFILSILLPIFILFWLMMGGNSIAIDLFTAEKERKTLEFLLILPVERKTILLSKFLITLSVSIFTLSLAIASIGLSLILLWRSLPDIWKIYLKEIKLSFIDIFLFLIFSVLLSSILNWIQVFFSIVSRSIKEAEYYLYPLVVVVILPGVISIFSEVTNLRNTDFLIPLLNICYIFKEILIKEYNIFHILTALLSSIFFNLILYKIVIFLFQKEKIIFTY